MSQLKITKVSQTGWGMELLGEGSVLLRSQKSMSKDEVISVTESLKSEGPKAPVLEASKVQPGEEAWVIEKARGGWAVQFTPVTETSFELLLKLDEGGEPPKAAEEAIALVKKCLEDVKIVWGPPIAIKIDNEPYEAPENPMSANDILRLGGLDPDNHYLVQIKDGERIKYEGKGEQPIFLLDGAEFVGHYTGPRVVSQLDG